MNQIPSNQGKRWHEKISRSGYFVGALLLHLVVFILVATWVVFPAFNPPETVFSPAYVKPPQEPKPVPPPSDPTPTVTVQSDTIAPAPIVSQAAAPFHLTPVPVITPSTGLAGLPHPLPHHVDVKPNTISPERLRGIRAFIEASRLDDIISSDGKPGNIKAKFAVYVASYADGDWGCNVHMTDGKIDAGSLPNLMAKVGEWSHGHITGEVAPVPLNIGGPDLADKKPPFIFFTGHKDFKLTDEEVRNLQSYVQVGGLIWGDNALAGRGSRFDVAFRREMKRVVPDIDKNFEPVLPTDAIFADSWFRITALPSGMNYYAEPMEHLDIDGVPAILYTPNDYSDMFTMRILPGDTAMSDPVGQAPSGASSTLITPNYIFNYSSIFYRNYTLPNCLACDQLGMNVIGYLLVRFDNELLLTP